MEIKKTYKYFNLDTFESVSEEKTISFSPAADVNDERIQALVNDEKIMLRVFNSYLKSQALSAAETEVTSKGGKRTVVLAVVKPFRALPPFNAIYKKNPDGSTVTENGEPVIDRKAQTKAILDMVKTNETMLNAIREGSKTESDEDETEDSDNDE